MTEVNTRTITIPQLHDMIRGYVKTALLRTALDLRVFDELVGAPAQATAVAEAVGADARGMRILLDALTAIGLLHRDGARYALLPGGERLLVSTSPQFFGHASRLSASDWEWDAQKRLIDAVRRGGTVMETHALTPDFSYYTDWANHTSWFHSGTAELMADHLVPWAAGRDPVDVLDIGCSHGGYGFTFAQRVPQARIWGLDFPNILQITKRNAEQLGLADRVRFIAGDMFEVPLAGPRHRHAPQHAAQLHRGPGHGTTETAGRRGQAGRGDRRLRPHLRRA